MAQSRNKLRTIWFLFCSTRIISRCAHSSHCAMPSIWRTKSQSGFTTRALFFPLVLTPKCVLQAFFFWNSSCSDALVLILVLGLVGATVCCTIKPNSCTRRTTTSTYVARKSFNTGRYIDVIYHGFYSSSRLPASAILSVWVFHLYRFPLPPARRTHIQSYSV